MAASQRLITSLSIAFAALLVILPHTTSFAPAPTFMAGGRPQTRLNAASASSDASPTDSATRTPAVVLIDPVTDWKEVVAAARTSNHVVLAVPMPDVSLPAKFRAFLPTSEALRSEGVEHVAPMLQRDVFSITRELQLLETRCNLQITGVIPLSEVAVEVSDLISSCLGVPHNPLESLVARRDKGLMKQVVEAAGLRVAKHARVRSVEDLRAAVERLSLAYPIVIKTPSGFSTTDVHICSSESEAIHALDCIIGKIGPDGRPVTMALLEEYLAGTEFAINLLAFDDGKRILVTDVWRYRKTDRARYEHAEVCHPDDHPELVSYAREVAKAVGVRYGAAHVELKARDDGSGGYTDPVMIEVGARLSGGRKSTMAKEAIDHWDPFAALVDAHCGRPCQQVPDNECFLTPHRFVRHLFLPIEKAGTIKDVRLDTSGLRTLHSSAMMVRPGERVEATSDIVSCAGFVWLVGERELVDEDADRVRSSFSLVLEED